MIWELRFENDLNEHRPSIALTSLPGGNLFATTNGRHQGQKEKKLSLDVF